MATSIITHGKWKQKHLEEEEEEEALSLCDLPDNLIDQDQDQTKKPDSDITAETQEEFVFHSWGCPVSKEPEMCTADEVFFQGQILPLHLSSKTTLSHRHSHQCKQCEWISESLDHSSSSEFQSNSSRSSSIRSQNSSSSTTTTTTTTTTRISKPRVQHQFHTHPIRRSSSWEFFRLGVVPAPEIGLQDIKVRSTNNNAKKNSVSYRNSSINGTNFNTDSTNNRSVNNGGKSKNNILKQLVRKSGGLFSGCKCSIETVQSGIVINRSGSKGSNNKTEITMDIMKEKVPKLKRRQNKHSHRIKQEKKAVSRLRTFEWVKVHLHLHANYPHEEALLSYS